MNELWGRYSYSYPWDEYKTAVMTVVARVNDAITASLRLTNTAAIPYYDSQPGDGPGPRHGEGADAGLQVGVIGLQRRGGVDGRAGDDVVQQDGLHQVDATEAGNGRDATFKLTYLFRF
mgnify:CR=1 FL=1